MSLIAYKSSAQEIISRTDLSDDQTSIWIVRSSQCSFLLINLAKIPQVGDKVEFEFGRDDAILGFNTKIVV